MVKNFPSFNFIKSPVPFSDPANQPGSTGTVRRAQVGGLIGRRVLRVSDSRQQDLNLESLAKSSKLKKGGKLSYESIVFLGQP